MTGLAFHIDVSSCSGCKACQLACKDAHGLEAGRLWRRVVEVEGGEWTRKGNAWCSTVFAYTISLSCMHCERPACMTSCPTQAIVKRADGVVAVDGGACIGCRYCGWACPYGAPQFDAATGTMSKCDFCADERDAGRPPACVSACPLRALDWGPIDQLQARHGTLAQLPPLPDGAQTGATVVISPPARMSPLSPDCVQLANDEEILR
ncbi:MAG TPA: DMSO/selenate family reductase complex B subunit [Vicinamibacterales bacterium]|jgi:anaerobic dimethyl sulfoxide reductase subunit B (iron-sulfur subunit)